MLTSQMLITVPADCNIIIRIIAMHLCSISLILPRCRITSVIMKVDDIKNYT